MSEHPIKDMLTEYHNSHNCNPGKCLCKCGCTIYLGCRALTELCSHCHMAVVRYDDDEHGFPLATPQKV